MICYFDCGNESQGICQYCGRAACKEHSQIILDKFVCSNCACPDPKSALEKAKKIISNKWNSMPKCDHKHCNVRLIDEQIRYNIIGEGRIQYDCSDIYKNIVC